jgi:DNA polymerase-3 subunit gamma/tau
MSDTIRSRTQHLQFHLLASDTLAEHIKWVAGDAGLELSQVALDAAIAQGGGSARDTLSALELLANSGGDVSDAVDLDEFLDALIDGDAGRVLTAVAHAVSIGRDPRTVTEQLVRHLRDAFLSLMAPELVVLPRDRVDAIAARAQKLGAASLVRAIERLGLTLVDMRHAPDPRILVEVALVQLTNNEAGTDLEAVLTRVERLEQTIKQLRESGPAPATAGAPRDPATGRAVLGGAARGKPAPPATAPEPASAEPHTSSPRPTPASAAAGGSIADVWEQTVKGQVKPIVRALYSAGSFVGGSGDTWQFSVPNEAHGAKCATHKAAVEKALADAIGAPVNIEFVVGARSHDDDEPSTPASRPASRPAPPIAAPATAPGAPQPATPPGGGDLDDAADIDMSELVDAPPESVKTPIDRLAEAFPGSEMVTEA